MLRKLKRIFSVKKNKITQPEKLYISTITDEIIVVEHPDREPESIKWNEIEIIYLVNTDDGPICPDVWLILEGKEKGCSIPQGSEGFEKVYDIISKYDGFDFESFINSMSCTDNQRFILWQKKR